MRTTCLQGPWGSSWIWLGSITYLCLNPWIFYLTFSPWTAEKKEWESSLVSSICQPDKANPPQEWRRSCCTSCLTLRHFCHPAACAQQQDHGSCSSSSHAEAMLSAELVSYHSQAVKKTQQPCTFWPCGKYLDFPLCPITSVRSDRWSTSVIQDGLWDGNYGPWSRGPTYPCSGEQGKQAKVCNCGIFSGHLVPVPPQTSHGYFQLSLLQFNLHCCVCSGQKISGKRLFSILNEPLLNEPTRKPLCRK